MERSSPLPEQLALLSALQRQCSQHLQTLTEIGNDFQSLFRNKKEGMWEAVGIFLNEPVKLFVFTVLWLCKTNLMLKKNPEKLREHGF